MTRLGPDADVDVATCSISVDIDCTAGGTFGLDDISAVAHMDKEKLFAGGAVPGIDIEVSTGAVLAPVHIHVLCGTFIPEGHILTGLDGDCVVGCLGGGGKHADH